MVWFSIYRRRREWLPNLPSQGLMLKTHDYLQYRNNDKIIYSSYIDILQTSYHLNEREIEPRWSRIWRKLATVSTSGQLYTERSCA